MLTLGVRKLLRGHLLILLLLSARARARARGSDSARLITKDFKIGAPCLLEGADIHGTDQVHSRDVSFSFVCVCVCRCARAAGLRVTARTGESALAFGTDGETATPSGRLRNRKRRNAILEMYFYII